MRIPARRALAVVAVLAALPLAFTQPGSAAGTRTAVAHGANGRAAKARFHATPKSFTLKHGAGEPTLGITKQGEIFVTLSSGCVTSCKGEPQMLETVAPHQRAIWASSDKGKTWRDVSPGDTNSGVTPHAFSLDPYILVDEHPDGDRIFDIDLTLACAILSYSDDRGKSWVTNPLACGEPVNDHQTLFAGPAVSTPTVGYPHMLYYCFNHPAFTKCSKSFNGGLTFVPTAQITLPECSGLNGHGIVDKKGVVYVPLGSNCGQPLLAVSKDEGNTWTIVRVSDDVQAEKGGDPSVAIDAAGNLYYLFVEPETRHPFLSVSRNGGKTWSKPVDVAPKGIDATNLATLTVGAPGKVAVAYYGTKDADDREIGWNGYISSGVDVLSKSPTFYTGTVNDPKHPLKMGACGPGRCGRVLDFIDVEIAPDGQPWAVYVDACLATCEKTKQESYADNLGVVGTLAGGPNLMKK